MQAFSFLSFQKHNQECINRGVVMKFKRRLQASVGFLQTGILSKKLLESWGGGEKERKRKEIIRRRGKNLTLPAF